MEETMNDVGQNAMRKVWIKFMPLLLICYIVSHLDRVNVGYAALTMNTDLGFSNAVFGLGAGLFFITYFAFEIPSNVALKRFGARRWIARIMLTWGALSGSMAFVQGEASFYTIRLLLGAAEAGFFPGIIFFLTLWVPNRWRATFVGAFMLAIPLASVLGAPISAFLMNGSGLWGLKSWQTMFIVEALPAVLLAFVVLGVLRDKPEDAEWLTVEEKNWLVATLASEGKLDAKVSHDSIGAVLRSPKIWLLSYIYFCLAGLSYGLAFFLPQIMRDTQLTIIQTGFATATPFLIGAVAMVLWGRSSDRRQERRAHALVALGLAVGGMAVSVLMPTSIGKMAAFAVAAIGLMSALPIFWTLPSLVMGSTVGAAGIATISSIGNLSGFTQSLVMGVIRDQTGSYDLGLLLIAAMGTVAFIVLLSLTRNLSHAGKDVQVGAAEVDLRRARQKG